MRTKTRRSKGRTNEEKEEETEDERNEKNDIIIKRKK
jgi:hypothetical protein